MTVSILFGTRFLPMIPRSVVAATHLFEWAEIVVLGWNALEGSHPFFSQLQRPPAGASSPSAARWPVSPAPSWRCAGTTVASHRASAPPLTCSPARARPWAFRPSSAGWRPRRRARWRALAASIVPAPRGLASRAWSRAATREASHGHQGTLRRPRPNDHLAWHLLGEPWVPRLVAVAPASLRVRISDRSFRPEITSRTIEVASPRCASTSCSAFAALQAPTRGSSPFCTRQLDISYLACYCTRGRVLLPLVFRRSTLGVATTIRAVASAGGRVARSDQGLHRFRRSIPWARSGSSARRPQHAWPSASPCLCLRRTRPSGRRRPLGQGPSGSSARPARGKRPPSGLKDQGHRRPLGHHRVLGRGAPGVET